MEKIVTFNGREYMFRKCDTKNLTQEEMQIMTIILMIFETSQGDYMIKKTGFSKAVCKGCAYCKNKKCTIAKKFTDELTRCPEGYTHELIREINEDIIRRFNGLPHSNIFAREW